MCRKQVFKERNGHNEHNYIQKFLSLSVIRVRKKLYGLKVFYFVLSSTCSTSDLRSKVLSLGKVQINLAFPSLNRTFAGCMGILYLVPTPVGNMEDMTMRAVRILKEADVVLAEDTRTSGVLLKHFGIQNRLLSHHKFNEHGTSAGIVERLKGGQTIALISDAGTPGISDPGFLLAREAIAAGIEVQALPGATAFVPALVSSGLPCDRFCFEGFLPQKKGRQTRLESLKDESRTMIFYESPYRLVKTLEQFAAVFGEERQVSVCREISKVHEESVRGTLADVAAHFRQTPPKGEIVIVVAGVGRVKD